MNRTNLAELPAYETGDPIAPLIREMLIQLGENPAREGLMRTPDRVACAMRHLVEGYRQSPDVVLNRALFEAEDNGLVVVRNVEFFSLCEHHMLPFTGRVHVAYLPDTRVIGLSKIPRLIEIYARRLQIQERLTAQIADCIERLIKPVGVCVITEARHFCMMMRGVEKQHSDAAVNCWRGVFKENDTLRREVMSSIERGRLPL